MDDIFLTGPLLDVIKAFHDATALLQKITIEVNTNKTQIFATDWSKHGQPKALTKIGETITVQYECIRILGAYVGRDDTCSHKLEEIAAKHDVFFASTAQLSGEEQLAVLSICGIPKMNYIARTHDPTVAQASFNHFETALRSAIETLAEVSLSADSRAIASLPVQLGGLGLRDWRPIIPFAFDASRLNQKGYQHTRTAAFDLAEQKRLQDIGRIRVDAAQPDSGSALRPPSIHEPTTTAITPRAFGAFLRLRLNTPHRLLPRSAACDGCQAFFSDMNAWQQHVIACPLRPAPNASSTHALLKQNLASLLRESGIAVEAHEPSDYAFVTCKGCNAQVILSDWAHHESLCNRASQGHTRGTDVRFHLTDGSHVVDITTISEEAPSKSHSTMESLDNGRIHSKRLLYAAQAASKGERLHIATIFAGGYLGKETLSLCRSISSGSRGTLAPWDVARSLRRTMALGVGTALAAAEHTLGVLHGQPDTSDAAQPTPNADGDMRTHNVTTAWQPRDGDIFKSKGHKRIPTQEVANLASEDANFHPLRASDDVAQITSADSATGSQPHQNTSADLIVAATATLSPTSTQRRRTRADADDSPAPNKKAHDALNTINAALKLETPMTITELIRNKNGIDRLERAGVHAQVNIASEIAILRFELLSASNDSSS
jgi:hypothetical protein